MIELPQPDDLEHAELYWLHVTGPDGPVVLLGQWDGRTTSFLLIDDACTPTQYDGATGSLRNKWTVYAAERIARPEPVDPHLARTGAGEEGL